MNPSKPALSVICVFRNRKEWIEPTLKALYSIKDLSCEFIFIDDGSTDGSAETIRSLITHYEHEQTIFFEHEAALGRGNSLNIGLEQVTGEMLWIPECLQSIDESLLTDAVEALKSSHAQFAIGLQEPLPESALDWLLLLQNNRLPFDRNFLFDLQNIKISKTFLDPHWTTRHASEWAIRLQSEADPIVVVPFSGGETEQLSMDDRSKKECILALLRTPNLSLSGQEKAFRLFRSFGHSDHEHEKGSMDNLYEEGRFLYKTGNRVASLEILNKILATAPEHRQARALKVEILEKMRRYVEAAEVKHEGNLFLDDRGVNVDNSSTGIGLESASESESESVQKSEFNSDTKSDFHPDTDPETDPGPASKLRTESESSTNPESDSPLNSKSESESESESVLESESAIAYDNNDIKDTDKQFDADAGTPSEAEPDNNLDNIDASTFTSVIEEELSNQLPLSIIIPTAANRRPILEKCLSSVFRNTAPDRTHIIIINNGSVDDTAEYLDRLLNTSINMTVLTNDYNLGFAAAVNQGLAKCGDGAVLVMHNDVVLQNPVPARLALALEKNPDIGLISPKTDHTWNEWQSADNNQGPFTEVDFVDGYCMAFRNDPGLTMSKQYGLAFFDDADFCMRIHKKGFRIVVAEGEQVMHLSGLTTGDLGLTLYSKSYWKNAAAFHKKWHIEPQFPAEKISVDPLHQFVIIGRLINPFFPEKHLLEYFEELFTSEQKTRILHADFPPDVLKAMIRLMMAANQREVLRRLEQQLDSLPPDIRLYHDLIIFYFDRTIYSRCKLYINKINPSESPVAFELFRLKIAIGEKDYQIAATLLKEMMDRIPTHPEVLLAAAEIHRRNGNREQSEKFISIAKSLNPYVTS